MPDINETIADGLPRVTWTDSEYSPYDLAVWAGPVIGFVLGTFLTNGWMGPLIGVAAGIAVGNAAYHGFFKYPTKQRECSLVRTPTGLVFSARPDLRSPHQNTIPYPELTGFAVEAASEWFDRRQDRVQGESVDSIDPFVLLAQMQNGSQMVLASHVGSKHEMAKLHVMLTDVFIMKRHMWK